MLRVVGPKQHLRDVLPNAIFTGFLSGENLARAYASSDIFFFPSESETFGNVTLEAMACGLPVVAARATGSASIVKHGTTGFLVEPGSISSFADRLQSYCDNPDLRAQQGSAALAEAQKYEWDEINNVVAETYIRMIRQRAARSIAGN